MVGLVLLIALTNVVMLLMARNATRQTEFSVAAGAGCSARGVAAAVADGESAAGDGGWRAGVGICGDGDAGRWAGGRISIRAWRPIGQCCCLRWACLVFAAVLFGLAPFRVAIAGGAELALKTSAATSGTDAGKTRVGKVVVAMQMALCVVLLVGGGLLIRTMRNLREYSAGDADGGAGGVWCESAERAFDGRGDCFLSRDVAQASRVAGRAGRDGDE